MAQLKSTNITGNLSVTGNVLASKIIKLGGTTYEVLLADGNVAKVSTTAQTVAPNAVTNTAARTYIVQKNGDQLVVNVPWVKGESSGGTLTEVNLVGGGGITLSSNTIDSDSDSITISHTDTSSQTSVTTGGRTYVNSITLDEYGHVTALGTNTETVTDTGATSVEVTGTGNAITTAEYSAAKRKITFTKGSTFLTSEADTLQTVTNRGATTNKAITTAGLTTTSTLYITGTTGHREGIRIAPFGNLSSIWWNATGTQDYTTGQMWGITAYDKNYTIDTTKTNTFRFRGPTSATATSATDQMWINTSGLVTSRGGFAKSGSSDSYVLLAGGGTKALSEFGIGTGGSLDLSNYVDLTSPQTISGNKTFTGNVITSNNKFEIKATGNTDDSWIKLTNASDDGYYAFGIRRPYNTYGLQLKIKAAGKPESEAEYYDIWNAHNDGSGSGLDADKLDGQEGTYYLDYNNFTNKPTIPAAQIQSDWNQTNTSKADYIKNKPTIPTVPANVVTGSSLTSNQVIVGNGNSTIKDSGISLSTKGNASAKAAVVRPNPGQIHSVYYVMTEGETARASWGYNATTDCVELAWR